MDWRDMFIRYSNVIGQAEGVDFLYSDDWTEEEWKAIKEAVDSERLAPLPDYGKGPN